MKENINKIELLIKNKKFDEVLDYLNNSNKKDFKEEQYNFIKGFSYLNLNNYENAIKYFSLAIKIDKKNPTIYFYRGLTYSKINEYKKAIEDYNKIILLKPNSAEIYNNLAQFYYVSGNNEKSIEKYLKSIELNKNEIKSYIGLLWVLSKTNNFRSNESKILSAHKDIKNIHFNYSTNTLIEDSQISKFLDEINKIIEIKLINFDLNITQTYREEKIAPNCNRHKSIFNKVQIIPKYCFGCYKIQIDLKNVLELIKLHIVFDNINFQNQNYRKCMIEIRPNISGKYKGFIFCESIKEAEIILKKLKIILSKNLKDEFNLKIKRGCSEYYEKYPSYNDLSKNALKYNSKWNIYENEFDKKNPNLIFKKNPNPTLKGTSLFDAIVFKNWLSFAKKNGDESWKQLKKIL